VAVLLVATGGTIASRPRPDGAVAASLGGADLLARLPLEHGSDVEVVDVAGGPSWNFDRDSQTEIVRLVARALGVGSTDGVVVTHGTDTVEESAWLTELLARPLTARGAVVFTAAMRHADEVGADGPRNLADALSVARSTVARDRGVLVCVNGELHHARWVLKTDTTAVHTFRSPSVAPVGHVVDGRPVFTLPSPPPPPATEPDTPLDARVAVVVSHAGVDAELVDWHLDRGCTGIVVEAPGAGNAHEALVPGIARAIDVDVPVVVSSRCLTGPVAPIYGGPGGHAELAAMGVIGAGDLSTAKARVALTVALGRAEGARTSAVRAFFEALA
jgi:L-asparaginase